MTTTISSKLKFFADIIAEDLNNINVEFKVEHLVGNCLDVITCFYGEYRVCLCDVTKKLFIEKIIKSDNGSDFEIMGESTYSIYQCALNLLTDIKNNISHSRRL